MRALLLAVILCSVLFRSGRAQVTLSPRGEKLVCASSPIAPPQDLQLTCSTQDFALWSTSGFGEGLADQTRVSAVSLADTNLRVTTTDTNSLMNPSAITLFNLTHDDHGAMVTCGGGVPSDQQSVTLSVGPPKCTVSLRVSSTRTTSFYIRWSVEECLGTMPTGFGFQWFKVGGTVDLTSNFVSVGSFYTIYQFTGLLPNTQYLVLMSLLGTCGIGTVTTVLAETDSLTDDVSGRFFTGGTTGGTNVAVLAPVLVFLVLLVVYGSGVVLSLVCVALKKRAAIKHSIYNLSPAADPSAEARNGDSHREMTELPSGPLKTGTVEYEDVDQLDASEDVTIESLVEQVQHSTGRGLPLPPPVPSNQGVEEYEDMDQHSASEVVSTATLGGRDHRSLTRGLLPPPPVPTSHGIMEYEDMEQHSASADVTMATTSGRGHCSQTWGLPPPPPLPIKDNADPQYEDLTQYNAREGVAMIANPCYDTKDS